MGINEWGNIGAPKFNSTRTIRRISSISGVINPGPEISFLNVDKVWQETSITGKNILVAVLDDGLYYRHEDLKYNYDSRNSYDFVDDDWYPSPPFGKSSHGTKCAGIIAAKRNGRCRTGIAYQAKLAGVRILSQSSSSEDKTAEGLGYNHENIDIYSNSWGPKDNGYDTKGPGPEGTKALKNGALKGRNGLGSIYVFSSGNGGLFRDSCAFDGYVNSIYTVSVSAVTKTGAIPGYAEPCSSTIASTYGDEVATSDTNPRCNSNFGRTSAAAAFASGIVALLLEANNQLTWRDVQHLIIRTSDPKKAKIDADDWIVNGAGLMVHPSVGFGVMNAKKLVDAAKRWKNVPKQLNCTVRLDREKVTVRRSGTRISFSLPRDCPNIENLEHVHVDMTLSFSPRANLLIHMISPEGTTSQLLYSRFYDALTGRKDYRGLKVKSLHFWGENPTAGTGSWTVLVKSSTFRHLYSELKLDDFKITFYGTADDPLSGNTFLPTDKLSCRQDGKAIWKGYGSRCCGSSSYDSNNERCCSGKKIVEKSPLCGATKYDKCKKLCCDGKIRNIANDREEMFCCGNEKYSKKEHICCGRKKYPKSSCQEKDIYDEESGSYEYRYISHETKCSNGRDPTYVEIYPYKYCRTREVTCGNKKYNKEKQICCGGRLHDKHSCKKSRYYRNRYNIHQAKCWSDQTVTYQDTFTQCESSEEENKCGGQEYSKEKQICCGGTAYDKTSCKTMDRFPYQNRIHDAKCSSDGQTLTYEATSSGCGPREENSKNNCGGQEYSKEEQICCGEIVYDKSSCQKSLLWHDQYTTHEATCSADGQTPRHTDTFTRCTSTQSSDKCGGHEYSKEKQICCGGTAYDKTSCKEMTFLRNRYSIHQAECSSDGQTVMHKATFTECKPRS